jgi:ribosomal protein S18 acetylase RimI-like enzyme
MGIGRNLMAKAEALVSSKCISSIWLTAWSENHQALVFYKSIGYLDLGSTEYVIEGKGYENRVLYRELRNNTV